MFRSTFVKVQQNLDTIGLNKEEFENVLKPRLVSSSNSKEFFDTFLAILNK